jgi:hypothetical protein
MKNYTWSYKKENVPLSIKVEYLIKYGDLDEIRDAINDLGADYCKKIWIQKIIPDKRFNRLSYFLARFIFNISTNKSEILKFIREHQKPRFN